VTGAEAGGGDGAGQAPSAETEESLAEARAAGIHLMAVPTPFLVGRVNCYLIEDDPLTLVDTGPNSGKSLDELEQALAQLGHRVEDLGLIVITHQHMDHLGLLEIIARRSGAEVAALDVLGPYLRDFSASAAADDDFSMTVMRRHGVPAELATALGSVGAAFRAFGSSGHVSVPLREGSELTLRDRTLTARHRPGHSPSDTVFWDEQRRILIAGDHLLARISSNPLISQPLAGPPAGATAADRPHALVRYMASLRQTREMPARLVLGGHGPPVRDHAALIDERFRMSERRAGKIRRLLEPKPQTAYDIASQMWGNVAVTQAFLTISEVLGHLDLLIADGRAVEDDSEPVTLFEARDAQGPPGSEPPQACR
jgi:glyoxylase-like metal-dependent hydrolase (beta-lactamase superfamily II)